MGRHGAGSGGGRHPFWKTTIAHPTNETTRQRQDRISKRVHAPGIGGAGGAGRQRAASACRKRPTNGLAQRQLAVSHRSSNRSRATRSTSGAGDGNPAGRLNPALGAGDKAVRTHPGRSGAGLPSPQCAEPVRSARGGAHRAINRISDAPSCRTSSTPSIVVDRTRIRIRAGIAALVAPSRRSPTVTDLHAISLAGGK